MIALALHDVAVVIAAGSDTIGNIAPEAPPGSNGILRLMRWLMWFVMVAGIAAIIYAGGRLAWEKWNGQPLESPKMLIGACIGGLIATSASSILNTIVFNT